MIYVEYRSVRAQAIDAQVLYLLMTAIIPDDALVLSCLGSGGGGGGRPSRRWYFFCVCH